MAALPYLAAAYLQRNNRNASSRLYPALPVGLILAAIGIIWFVWVHRFLTAAVFGMLRQHVITIIVVAGLVAAAVVSRQRSMHAARTERSWLAALPVSRNARRVEALVLPLTPIIVTLAVISGFDIAMGAIFLSSGLSVGALFVAWRSLLLGALLGAAIGLAVPTPKAVTPHPGSRYVPHRFTRGRRPEPSISALGIWPIRRMFAMLQPKTLSRAVIPVLLLMPLGSTAASAMVWLGLFGALTAFIFLVISVVWVARAARHWLKPLPLPPHRLKRVVAARALLVMAGIGATAVWLAWVGRS
jgi:hypothetical protein